MVIHRDSIAAANEEVTRLRKDLQLTRNKLQDRKLVELARSRGFQEIQLDGFRLCRTLSGHTSKIYCLDWCNDRIVSASQDGRLIVWNAMTSQKTHVIKLKCPWPIACAFSPDGQMVACGGLDNVLAIYALRNPDAQGNPLQLPGHKGYISCCHFVPPRGSQVLTSSGDGTCMQWDVDASQKLSVFGDAVSGHESDVMSLSINPQSPNLFVSGSCDSTAKLWDLRDSSKAQRTFFGRGKDVNAVQFMQDGLRFGVGLDSGTCKIFDMRYGYQLQEYTMPDDPQQQFAVKSMAFSLSGRILFAAYETESHGENSRCYLWDTLTGNKLRDIGESHQRRVSCIRVSTDGSAVCTGSWDSQLKVWAYGRRSD